MVTALFVVFWLVGTIAAVVKVFDPSDGVHMHLLNDAVAGRIELAVFGVRIKIADGVGSLGVHRFEGKLKLLLCLARCVIAHE